MTVVRNRINTLILLLVLFALLAVVAMLATGVRGGPLDPPGPPGSTQSVRLPGTPISQPAPGGFPIVISESGHYYLTANIQAPTDTNGIAIDADNVTIDLMGFTLRGAVTNATSGPGSAFIVDVAGGAIARKQIVIRNGVIDGWTFCGIGGALFELSVFEDLQISGGRCGIEMGMGSVVRRVAIGRVSGSSSAYGIQTFNAGVLTLGGTIEDSTVTEIAGSGIIMSHRSIVRNSTVNRANLQSGGLGGVVVAGSASLVEGSYIVQSSPADIRSLASSNATIRDNTVQQIQIDANSGSNFVIDNSCVVGSIVNNSALINFIAPDGDPHENICAVVP